ncbi:sugar phosphate isomerase/epimerase family protein [Massiliimalia timonensis]|uniref:Sugar phosphate isomerase/epimerase n=1 Tax=Massiliimalia timonensis TaxID=1987501 RepID=A0A8J6P9R0_9FIRM|nr:sugar phosphate isomerase/epimerase family protein [Massiliimalia timonensis]MBC8609653.1 sugar phosphate isomerase/epimerase [Massiliimalia timonensis]MBS7175179.1 sugar phosphate isomerase/epimerase [Clostridiales bacterium]
MERKYSIITGFMGKVQDRFIDYQPPRDIKDMIEMASRVKGCSGLEVVYPQNFTDPKEIKNILDAYGLGVSTVNLNVKGEEKWRYGSFSNPDPKIRREAVEALKRAMDHAAALDCSTVTTALLNDGVDYPFELNYLDAFQYTLEGIREAAEYRKDIKISLEYKQSEPRIHCLLNNAGKMAYLAQMTNQENVGVTLDFGHALQALEVPADSASFLGQTGKLFYVHINDNFRNWDWDMVPGTVNLWDYIEFALALKKVGYNGWITADVFPQRHDPIMIMEKTFDWMDYIFAIADKIDEDKLAQMQKELKTFEIMDYIRSLL